MSDGVLPVFVFSYIAVLIVGGLVGWHFAMLEAVNRGHAEYDPKTGERRWKKPNP